MAQIIPEPFASKHRGELYDDIVSLSRFIEQLKEKINDVHAEVKLRDAQLQKQRADIMKLKSIYSSILRNYFLENKSKN